jgi:hypothetical protein
MRQRDSATRLTTGTFSEPYVKRDGTKTVKWSGTFSAELIHSMRVHVAAQGLSINESAWVAQAIRGGNGA